MARYIQRLAPFQAPSRYVFKDPDTKHWYAAASKEELLRNIIGYREQNRLEPIQALESVLENYWCSLPENYGKCKSMELKRGWFDYVKGGIALLENLFYGEKNMVSKEEAERRAAICVGCPYNFFPDKSAFIAWSDELAFASTRGRMTSVDDKLGSCEVCSCTLKAKVHYGGKIDLSNSEYKQMKEVGCWQIEAVREVR